tara:strand:- start:27 stop:140 length:114 start_codon:yes stop_codon:yes gene_type:complete
MGGLGLRVQLGDLGSSGQPEQNVVDRDGWSLNRSGMF